MTTRETAEALGVTERTIQRHLKEMREEGVSDNVVVRGDMADLDEKEVTIIKTRIERSGRTDLANVCELPSINTDLEMMIMESKVSEWRVRKIEELQKQLSDAQPKIEFFDTVTSSNDTIDMSIAAKVLSLPFGRNTLFAKLREMKILMADNVPYQEYINRGYFDVIEEPYTVKGAVLIGYKTVVYQKGLDFIRKAVK